MARSITFVMNLLLLRNITPCEMGASVCYSLLIYSFRFLLLNSVSLFLVDVYFSSVCLDSVLHTINRTGLLLFFTTSLANNTCSDFFEGNYFAQKHFLSKMWKVFFCKNCFLCIVATQKMIVVVAIIVMAVGSGCHGPGLSWGMRVHDVPELKN